MFIICYGRVAKRVLVARPHSYVQPPHTSTAPRLTSPGQCLQATASVDLTTDTAVQETIRRAFTKSTIVTIAHRLNTIIDFDKVVVMDAGKVAEHGSAHELLKKPDGLLSKLVKSTGESSATELRKRAKAAAAAGAGSSQ